MRALPSPVWWLYAGSFVNRFGSFVSVFLILYLVEEGYSPAQAGTAVAAYGLGGLISAVAGGYLADRLGRRNAIALSMFAAAASSLALSQARELGPIIVLTAAFGFTSELYRPASAALLTDLVRPERRLPAFAGYRLAINAGYAFGPGVAGLLAERSFFWLFVGEAVTSVVFGVLALFVLPEGLRTRRGEERAGEALRAIRRDRPFLLLFGATTIAAVVYFQSGSTFPLHVRAGGLSTAFYGLLISLNGALIVLLELPIVSVIRRFPAPRVIATGMALNGLGFAMLALSNDAALLVTSVVVWTVAEMIAAPTSNAYVAELAPAHLRGRYQGAYTLTFSLGLTIAPALGGRLFEWSPAGLWLLCGAAGLVAAAMILTLPSRRVDPGAVTAKDTPGVPPSD
jgi:MFS family permease